MEKREQYRLYGGKRLRRGYTTGTCATGAASAAAATLLGGLRPDAVQVRTPAGPVLSLEVLELRCTSVQVSCAVRKDAGDDPDSTNGVKVFATVSRIPEGIEVEGGEGVGRVTCPGLQCPVGAAAINPVPMRMIREALQECCRKWAYSGGLRAVISVPEGAELAARTFNPRLGIEGGISILGTSGLVEPMSEAALVDTIRAEMDVLSAMGRTALLLTPGNYGSTYAKQHLKLDLSQGVKCSNYIGEALDYARFSGFQKLLLVGHAGKLVKLAGGIMNTHSSVADARMELLACHAALQGLPQRQVAHIFDCITVDEVDQLLQEWEVADRVWNSVGTRVTFHLRNRLGEVEFGFAAFCNRGTVMASDNLEQVAQYLL